MQSRVCGFVMRRLLERQRAQPGFRRRQARISRSRPGRRVAILQSLTGSQKKRIASACASGTSMPMSPRKSGAFCISARNCSLKRARRRHVAGSRKFETHRRTAAFSTDAIAVMSVLPFHALPDPDQFRSRDSAAAVLQSLRVTGF
jgi:hypothetical protein